jgi:flagellar protein FlaG
MVTPVIGKADLLASFLKEHRSGRGSAKLVDQTEKSDPSYHAYHATSLSLPEQRNDNELKRPMAKIEEVLQSAGLQVRLLVDRETERVVVKVVRESGEVVRQFPPEEILELAKYLSEEQQSQLERGVLLEERV